MSQKRRKWQASWRDTLLLLRQFRLPLFLFALAILGCGTLYFYLAKAANEPLTSMAEAYYMVLTLALLQPTRDFPTHASLQVFYFLMPVIGIGILAQGLADFGILLFNRKVRNKEWEMAVASTFDKHTILIGMGHLGYRVIENLHQMDEQVVVIDRNPAANLVNIVQKMGIPVIQDDGANQTALEAAGVKRAKTIVLCTQNDTLNLHIAVKARSLNPKIQVVLRIFDDDFAQSLQQQFGFVALSATGMAAPAFAAAAAGADVTRPITVEGQSLSLARLMVNHNSHFIGLRVAEIEKKYDISIVLLKRGGEADLHPTGERRFSDGDLLVVLGSPEKLNLIVHDIQ